MNFGLKKQSDNDQNSQISEEELKKYLEENPPAEKMMTQTPEVPERAESAEAPTPPESAETPSPEPAPAAPQSTLPPPAPPEVELGPRPINIDGDFRPPSAKTAPPPSAPPPSAPPPSAPAPLPNEEPLPTTETPPLPPPKKSGFKKFCSIFIILILLLVGAAAGYWYFFATGTLSLSITPTDAIIKVDDKNATANESLKLKPGKYKVQISKEGYVSHEEEVTISIFKTTTLKIDLKKNPLPVKLFDSKIQDFYLVGDEVIVLGNEGKTLYKLEEAQVKGIQTPEEGTETQATEAEAQTETSTQAQTSETQGLIAKAITPDTLANVEKIIWHPKESLAIFKIKQDKVKLTATPFAKPEIEDGKEMTWLYDFNRYDLVNQKSTFWGADIGDIVWSPDGEKIYYYFAPEGGEKTLVAASKNNQNLERLLNLKKEEIENPQLSISPDGKYLNLIPRSAQYETNYVYLFEILTQKLTKLVSTGNNLAAKFSPDSKKILYATYSKNEEESANYSILSVIDIEGKNKKELNVRAFLEKADFSSDAEYVLAAESKGKDKKDIFIKINIASKNKNEFICQTSEIIKLNKVLFSADNKAAYFMITDYLYRLELIENK